MSQSSLGDVLDESHRREIRPYPGHTGPKTYRTDRWWALPLVTSVVLLGFVVYGTWVAFQNANYYADPYVSPFYSSCLSYHCGAVPGSHGAPQLGWFGTWWIVTPAVIILIFPFGLRLMCFYYRKAYYRSRWQAPPACGVPEPHRRYAGETRFPLVLQNVHRYFPYAALVFNVILTWDAIIAFNWGGRFGMGLGRLVLCANAAMCGLACGVVTMAIAMAFLLASQALQAARAAKLPPSPRLPFGFSPS